jgi:hypothetical protein
LPFVEDFVGVLLSKEVVETSTNLLESYGGLLREHPISTKCITAAILACIGDSIAQFRSKDPASATFEYDARRGMTFLLFGALYTGAFQHVWFNYLSQHIAEWGKALKVWGPDRVELPVDGIIASDEWWSYFDVVENLESPPTEAALALGKLFINQGLVIPTVYMPLFFIVTGLVAGLNWNEIKARAQSLYFPLLRRNYFFWLPIQFLQFFVIPAEWQIPYVSSMSLLWTVILSSIGGSTAPASPSTIVAYENTDAVGTNGEEYVTVLRVDPGPVNEILDEVRLEDVQHALVPDKLVDTVKDVFNDGRVGAASGGLALGLLAAAADDAMIGSALASAINGEVGMGVEMAAAAGAGVGLIAAAAARGTDPTKTEDSKLQLAKVTTGPSALLTVNDSSTGDDKTTSATENTVRAGFK